MKAAKRPAARRTTKAQPAPAVPFSIAVVQQVANGGTRGFDPDFLAAWAYLPAFIRALVDGTSGDFNGVNLFRFVEQRVQEEAERRARMDDEPQPPRSLGKILQLLNETDPDYNTTLQLAYSAPAFNLGLALGCALSTGHASVTLTGGGAR